jgi:hypothetical protein
MEEAAGVLQETGMDCRDGRNSKRLTAPVLLDEGTRLMSTDEYRIEGAGIQFTVIDPWVSERHLSFRRRSAARHRTMQENDTLFEEATLMDISIKLLMQTHSVSRETASYWLHSVSAESIGTSTIRLGEGDLI